MANIITGGLDLDAPALARRIVVRTLAHYIVLEDCIAAVEAATARRDHLEAHIEAAAGLVADASGEGAASAAWPRAGGAATLVAELGDITRFANPRQFMAYLGLVPSEHSGGSTRRQGGITKAGNGAARHVDRGGMELPGFQHVSVAIPSAPRKVEQPIRDIDWKAQERLCRRYRKLAHAGKLKTVITAAIARASFRASFEAIAKQTRPETA